MGGFQETKRKHFCGRMWEPKDSDCFLENLRGFWTINHQASSFIRLLNLSQGRKLWGIWPHNCWQHCFVGLDQLNILFNLFFFLPAVSQTQKRAAKSVLFSPILHLPPPVDPSLPPSVPLSLPLLHPAEQRPLLFVGSVQYLESESVFSLTLVAETLQHEWPWVEWRCNVM